MKSLKQRLRAGETVRVFALARVVHPMVFDLFASAGGYHGFWLDQEHGGLGQQEIVAAATAGRAAGLDGFVRVAPTGYSLVTQCLEAGAGGVMAAQIHSAEQAREFISWARYAPEGKRGLNTSGYDAGYTRRTPAELVDHARDRALIGIQIETAGAVHEVDAIAALDGLDLLFVGPADLSQALGVVGAFHDDKLWEAIARVSRACQVNGVAWGAVVPDPRFARRAVELGCRMLTIGNDPMVMRRGIEAMQESFSEFFD